VVSSPAVDAAGLVYVGSTDGFLYCFNPGPSGGAQVRWRLSLGGPVWSSPAIGRDGALYVAYGHPVPPGKKTGGVGACSSSG
jgi:outer membrane protein assembly factor BamB